MQTALENYSFKMSNLQILQKIASIVSSWRHLVVCGLTSESSNTFIYDFVHLWQLRNSNGVQKKYNIYSEFI